MTPTNELRARLDECGINWWTDKYYRDTNTCWRVGDFEWRASEKKDGKLLIGCTCVKYLTPEQAIAATVGTGTCHIEVHDNLDESEGMGDVWLECDKCHWQMMLEPTTPRFKYCPNCGAKVVAE